MKNVYRICALTAWLIVGPVPFSHLNQFIKWQIIATGASEFDGGYVGTVCGYFGFLLIALIIAILPVWREKSK